MNWEMLSAIGQMLGAPGVIISLIYVAVQIRAQKNESQRTALTSLDYTVQRIHATPDRKLGALRDLGSVSGRNQPLASRQNGKP